jgi:hypothetical protein
MIQLDCVAKNFFSPLKFIHNTLLIIYLAKDFVQTKSKY